MIEQMSDNDRIAELKKENAALVSALHREKGKANRRRQELRRINRWGCKTRGDYAIMIGELYKTSQARAERITDLERQIMRARELAGKAARQWKEWIPDVHTKDDGDGGCDDGPCMDCAMIWRLSEFADDGVFSDLPTDEPAAVSNDASV